MKGRCKMKWLDCNKMRYVIVGFMVIIGLAGSDVKADFVFGTPTNLGSTVNSEAYEDCPEISADGLELYFHSTRLGGQGEGDIWISTRTSKDEPWGEPVNLGSSVNSSSLEFDACISADGLSLYVNSMRPGGEGEDDLWVATRPTNEDPWGEAVNLGSTVNSPNWEYGPSISADGLSLYFVSNRPDGYGETDIWVTTRATTQDDWAEPVNLGPAINNATYVQGPSISADGLVLFFESIRLGSGVGSCDLWMSRRATTNDPWGEPVNLGSPVNTQGGEKNPCLASDGRTLYFQHWPDANAGPWDLWQVSINPIVDFNGDGIVDLADLLVMIEHWGTDHSFYDIGPMPWGDGVVDVNDLEVLVRHWGQTGFGVSSDRLWIEAEAVDTITSPMKIYDDPAASGGKYIGTDDGIGNQNSNPPADGIATYNFAVVGGTYKISIRVQTPDRGGDSFWFRIQGATIPAETELHSSGWVRWNGTPTFSSGWYWSEVLSDDDDENATVFFTMNPGMYTLEVARREDGAQLDAIVILKSD